MANYNNLKAGIDAVIKTNGRQEISGAALNAQLKNMITELGAGYQYMGVATPATNPGAPDANVFYLASEAGTYTNFGGIVINEGEVCALVWNGTWAKQVTGAATADKLNQLGQEFEGVFSTIGEMNFTKNENVGLLRSANGTIDTNISTIRTSDFIFLPSSVKGIRYYDVFDNSAPYCGLALYDESQAFIAAVNTARTGVLDLSQYPSAKYVRYSSILQYPNNDGYIVLIGERQPLDDRILDAKFNSGTDNLPVYASANGEYDFYDDGKAWGVRNGVLTELAASGWARTELIPINRKMRNDGITASSLYAYTSANGYYSIIFLGKEKEVISYYDDGITESHELNVVALAIPNNAVYFVANGVAGKAKIDGTILSKFPSYSSVTRLENPTDTPLKIIKKEVGFAAMFLDWGFIGDSLSSGEMDCYENGVHVSPPDCDFYEHSWGQYICRLCGTHGYNFSVGGQTAHGWINETGERGWGNGVVGASANPKLAYTIALGTNDKYRISESYPVGTSADVNLVDYHNNANSFFGDYAGIIQRIRSIQPKAPIFVITTFKGLGTDEINNAIKQMPSLFDNVYLIDMNTHFINPYGTWKNGFVNVSHFSAAGYLMVAWATMNYIDMIVQNNPEKFLGQCLVGKNYELNP